MVAKKEQMCIEYETEIMEMQESYDLLMNDLVAYRNQLKVLVQV